MARNTSADGDGRSVVPLSLALLVFNVLGGGEAPRSPAVEPAAEARAPLSERPEDPTDPASVPRRVC